jgi:hypothetical protein
MIRTLLHASLASARRSSGLLLYTSSGFFEHRGGAQRLSDQLLLTFELTHQALEV